MGWLPLFKRLHSGALHGLKESRIKTIRKTDRIYQPQARRITGSPPHKRRWKTVVCITHGNGAWLVCSYSFLRRAKRVYLSALLYAPVYSHRHSAGIFTKAVKNSPPVLPREKDEQNYLKSAGAQLNRKEATVTLKTSQTRGCAACAAYGEWACRAMKIFLSAPFKSEAGNPSAYRGRANRRFNRGLAGYVYRAIDV